MRKLSSIAARSHPQLRLREQAGVRTVLLAGTCFIIGLGAGAYWFHRAPEPAAPDNTAVNVTPPIVAPPVDSPDVANPNRRRNITPVTPQPASPATIDEVKRAIPNLDSVSLEKGQQMLRTAALAEFAAAARDMEARVKAAQESFARAQNGGSEAEQQAAARLLQEAQAAEIQKLQEIAAKSKAQLEALQQLKAAGH